MSLPEIPQIVPETGVSGDYVNEYAGWPGLLYLDGVTGFYERLNERYQTNRAIKLYGERFKGYQQPTDVATLERIRKLDLIAHAIRTLVDVGKLNTLTKDDILGIVSRVYGLIHGNSHGTFRMGVQKHWEVALYTEKLGFIE